MANEIYHRSNWGNAVNDKYWADVYEKYSATNKMYIRSDYYENSNVTDKLMADIYPKPSILLTPTAYDNGSLHSVKPVQSFGSELVTNGDFATDSDWNKTTGWTISNGRANRSGVSSNTYISQDFNIEQGKKYIVKYDRTYISGNGETNLYSYFDSNTTRTTKGIYNSTVQETVTVTDTFVAGHTGGLFLRIYGISNFTGSIDNVSVKEVIDADFDFTRGSSATRVNEKGLIEDVQILSGNLVQNGDFSEIGSELVVNGDFATDSNWTKGIGWSISGGKAIKTSGTGSALSQTVPTTTVGKIYKFTFDAIVTSGVANATIYGVTIPVFSTSGTQEHTITATSTSGFEFYAASNFDGSIDNVSIKEVGQNWTFGTGWSVDQANSKAVFDGGADSNLTSSLTVVNGTKYRYNFTVSDMTTGALSLRLGAGNVSDLSVNSNGTYEGVTTSEGTQLLFRSNSGFDGSITNISVIEITDDTNLPRINYTNGEGSLLLEPQSTNLLTYSEDFSQWTLGSNSTLTYESNVVAPDGSLGVYKLTNPATSSTFIQSPSFSSSNPLTVSLYVKSTGSGNDNFNLYTGASNVSDLKTATSEWQRFNHTADGSSMYIVNSGDTFTSDIYIWGAQAEALSYATSYIPTESSTVTRLADVCNNAGSSDLINSTEGVLYVEAFLKDTGTFKTAARITATDISTGDGLWIYFRSDNKIQGVLRVGGVDQTGIISSVQTTDEYYKVAFKFKQNDFSLFVNGIEVATDTSGNTFSADTLSKLGFLLSASTNPFIGNVKCVAVFKEALSDTELQKLTTI